MKILNKININKIKRFFEPINQFPKERLHIIIKGIYNGLFDVYSILIIKYLTDCIYEQKYELALKISIIYLIILILFSIFDRINKNRGRVEIQYKCTQYLQNKYLGKFLKLDTKKVELIGTGKLINIIENGIDNQAGWQSEIILLIIQTFINVVFSIIFISLIGGIYGILFIVLFIILRLFISYINKKTIEYRKEKKENSIENTKQTVMLLMSKNEILQNNKFDKLSKKYEILNIKGEKIIEKLNKYLWLMFYSPYFATSLFTFGIFLYFSIFFQTGGATLGDFVALLMLSNFLERNIMHLVYIYKNFSNDFIQIEKMRDLFDNTNEIKGLETGNPFRYEKGNIQLINIDFSYENEKQIFSNFNLEIKGNQIIAFVGPSGGGKSTLLKIISGFLTPEKGDIIIDGQNLKEVSLISYFKNIGYLSQEPSIFDGTIYENLVFALSENPSKKELEKAIKAAKCEFIYKLINGIDTEIGERGVKLSGGEKQRLAIAKIMLKNPNIILLDEPTSALDSISENQVSHALNNLFKNKTVIIIAHRLQTVKSANEIIVIQGGKIVEKGNHKELIKLNGSYKKLLDIQTSF